MAQEATAARRHELRAARLEGAVAPRPGDAVVSFAGRGRFALGGALVVDFDENGVLCGHCGHRHCAPTDNLLTHLREVLEPLTAAGPVRGEAYDQGRFHLRQLCCGACGALVDAQVALDGAPWPFLRIDRTPG